MIRASVESEIQILPNILGSSILQNQPIKQQAGLRKSWRIFVVFDQAHVYLVGTLTVSNTMEYIQY